MKYNLIAIGLCIIGFLILFDVEKLISKDTNNSFLKSIKDNNLIVGIACLGAGYYTYSIGKKESLLELASSEQGTIPDIDLPSYEEAISSI